MQHQIPLTRDVVLIGGGHSHALLLRRWGMDPLAGVRLTVIDPNPTAPYSGMLPGHIAGHYARAELELDLVKLTRFAHARLILGRACAMDPDAHTVTIEEGRGEVSYDLASFDVGITSALPRLAGFSSHGLAAKPLGALSTRWEAYLAACAAGKIRPAVAVIGAGVAGVELAMAMMHALRSRDAHAPTVTIIEAAAPLTDLSPKTRAALLAKMNGMGVTLLKGVQVQQVCADHIMLDDGRHIPATLTIAAAGTHPYGWLQNTGLALHEGFISVDDTLRAHGREDVYAVGDCAHLSHAPRPKAGVYAVREAPYLYDNIRAALTGKPQRHFQPQKDYLKLISLGGKEALADKFGMRGKGAVLWRLKNHIDRKFMRKVHELPAMPTPPLPKDMARGVREILDGHPPLCGGCGAKVARAPLFKSLAALPAPKRDDVRSRPGDDAAILRLGAITQVITTDHLRAFSLDPWRMAQITAVHALGDVWAMGGAPQAVLINLTLPRMSAALQSRTLAEIMAAATQVIAASGAEIVGGHTSLGAEFSIGFSVTGLCEIAPITLAGAKAGDALILSKPIGSGVLMAGEMRLLADGRWVAAGFEQMARPNGEAARILAPVAHAMTDVTGFGLAGHLAGILTASQVAASLHLKAIPVLAGALELAQKGVQSSLFADNRSAVATLLAPEPASSDAPSSDARYDLLFDPQTAGGLLAAVPAARAKDLCADLRASGDQAALIGEIIAGPPMIRLL